MAKNAYARCCHSVKSQTIFSTATRKQPVKKAPEAVKANIVDIYLLCAPMTPGITVSGYNR